MTCDVYEWKQSPSLLHVVEEGCAVGTNSNGLWLMGTFGDQVFDTGFWDVNWHSYNAGEVAGTAHTIVHVQHMIVWLISKFDCQRSRRVQDQQYLGVAVRKMLLVNRNCISNWTNTSFSRPICFTAETKIDSIYVHNFIGGGLQALHCSRRDYPNFLSVTNTFPPLIATHHVLLPDLETSRPLRHVSVFSHQYNRLSSHAAGRLFLSNLANTTRSQWNDFSYEPFLLVLDIDSPEWSVFTNGSLQSGLGLMAHNNTVIRS